MERIHPAVRAANAEAVLLRQLYGALGITPLARSGLYLPPPPDTRTEFERMLDSYTNGPDDPLRLS